MMKKMFAAAAAASAMFMFAGCGESPTDVVKAWHNAIIEGNVEKANSLCTENMHTKNKLTIALMKWERDKNDGPQIRDLRSAKFVEEDIDDDTAEVEYNTDKQSGQEIKLVKRNGKWLIDSRD